MLEEKSTDENHTYCRAVLPAVPEGGWNGVRGLFGRKTGSPLSVAFLRAGCNAGGGVPSYGKANHAEREKRWVTKAAFSVCAAKSSPAADLVYRPPGQIQIFNKRDIPH